MISHKKTNLLFNYLSSCLTSLLVQQHSTKFSTTHQTFFCLNFEKSKKEKMVAPIFFYVTRLNFYKRVLVHKVHTGISEFQNIFLHRLFEMLRCH